MAEFLVKWVGRSHLHNEWVPQSQLARLAKRKLVNFKKRHGAAPCHFAEAAWSRVRPQGALVSLCASCVGGPQPDSCLTS